MQLTSAPTVERAGRLEAAALLGDEASDAGLLAAVSLAARAVSSISTDADEYRALSDADLVSASAAIGHERDQIGTVAALLAGEIARRSAPEFGSTGLAQRNGFRTPIEMVKLTTRVTGREAVQAVRTGTLLVETANDGTENQITGELVAPTEPWLSPVARALAEGILSIAAVESIRTGLGAPNSSVTVDQLTEAAAGLVLAGLRVDPDQLRKLARSARDEMDVAGIGLREDERRQARSWRMFATPDGGGRATVTFDPESWALAKAIYDGVTSPKLGGVRFVDPASQATRDAIESDPRSVEQLAFDGMIHLLKAGSDADPSVMIGTGAPVVKLLTTLEMVESARAARQAEAEARSAGRTPAADDVRAARSGFGVFEGQTETVSIATIQRHLCDGVSEPIILDPTGQPLESATRLATDSGTLDEGREHRLFTRQQKSRLAARDGGCRWPGCERPPSWCEAHHIQWWSKDHGPTLIKNGVLLCKHHHLLLHNNGWEIERRPDPGQTGTELAIGSGGRAGEKSRFGSGGRAGERPLARTDRYWLIPPPGVDPSRTPRLMETNSLAWRGLVA